MHELFYECVHTDFKAMTISCRQACTNTPLHTHTHTHRHTHISKAKCIKASRLGLSYMIKRILLPGKFDIFLNLMQKENIRTVNLSGLYI